MGEFVIMHDVFFESKWKLKIFLGEDLFCGMEMTMSLWSFLCVGSCFLINFIF